jgi:hypothetical protein
MTTVAQADLTAGFNEGTRSGSTTGAGKSVMASRMKYSRLIGALFPLGFLSYGIGFALVMSVVGIPDFLATISEHQTTLIFGAFLMLLNTAVDVGKAVLFFPVIENHGKRTAVAYLAIMILEVALMAVGIIMLLLLAPLGHLASTETGADWVQAIAALLIQGNQTAYLIAMTTLALGNIILWSLTFRVRLLPRLLSVWGVIGYIVLTAGCVAEIFGLPLSLISTIPGGLFEIALGFWLIVKGFEPVAYSRASA